MPNQARTIVAVLFGLAFAVGIFYCFTPVHGAFNGYCGTAIGAMRDDPAADEQISDSERSARHACAIEGQDRVKIGAVLAGSAAIALIVTLGLMPAKVPVQHDPNRSG